MLLFPVISCFILEISSLILFTWISFKYIHILNKRVYLFAFYVYVQLILLGIEFFFVSDKNDEIETMDGFMFHIVNIFMIMLYANYLAQVFRFYELSYTGVQYYVSESGV